MHEYLKTSKELLAVSAKTKLDRTGVGTSFKVFNHIEFNQQLGRNFSVITTKKMNVRSIIGELLGFIRGADSAAIFRELDCNVWNANANKQNPEGKPKNMWLQNPWRKGTDDVGRIYGVQWRNWEDTRIGTVTDYQRYIRDGYTAIGEFKKGGETNIVWQRKVDQLQNAVAEIKRNPSSRRIIITAWNPSDLEKGALPPCHVLQHYLCEELTDEQRIQALVTRAEHDAIWYRRSVEEAATQARKDATTGLGPDMTRSERLDNLGAPRHALNLIMYQRSADWILGSPYNITSYSTMMAIMCRMTNTAPGSLYYLTGDTHLYNNHRDAAKEQTGRTPSTEKTRLLVNPELRSLEDFEIAKNEDFRLFNYQNQGPLSHPTPMAI